MKTDHGTARTSDIVHEKGLLLGLGAPPLCHDHRNVPTPHLDVEAIDKLPARQQSF